MLDRRHFHEQGEYWPTNGRGKKMHDQRFGVLQVHGYNIGAGHHTTGMKAYTSFHVCDLAAEGHVVKTFGSMGKPGDYRVQRQRQLACEHADDLNFLDREYDRSRAA